MNILWSFVYCILTLGVKVPSVLPRFVEAIFDVIKRLADNKDMMVFVPIVEFCYFSDCSILIHHEL